MVSAAGIPPPFAPVLERLTADSRATFGLDVELAPIGHQERPFSYVLRVVVRDRHSRALRGRLFVKLFKDKVLPDEAGGMRARVVRDYDVTMRIYEWMSRWQDLGAVRPIACYPEHLAIVTEEAPGPSLLQYLNERAPWFPNQATVQELGDVAQRLGRWLRAFQTFVPEAIPDAPFSLDSLRDYVDVRLRRLVADGLWMTEDRRRQVLVHLDGRISGLRHHEQQQVPIHADFSLGNILVGTGRVVVLDFAMVKRGSRFHDLSRLFVQLDLLRAKPQFRPSTVAMLQRELLNGFDPDLSPHEPLFRVLQLMHRVNHYSTLGRIRERLPARLLSNRVRLRHRRWIEAELRGSDVP